jgi:hypothetical protein
MILNILLIKTQHTHQYHLLLLSKSSNHLRSEDDPLVTSPPQMTNSIPNLTHTKTLKDSNTNYLPSLEKIDTKAVVVTSQVPNTDRGPRRSAEPDNRRTQSVEPGEMVVVVVVVVGSWVEIEPHRSYWVVVSAFRCTGLEVVGRKKSEGEKKMLRW